MATFKVNFTDSDDTRRFKLPILKFSTLVEKLHQLVPVSTTTINFALKWKDSDGDSITIANDEDLEEARRANDSGVIKIFATVVPVPSSKSAKDEPTVTQEVHQKDDDRAAASQPEPQPQPEPEPEPEPEPQPEPEFAVHMYIECDKSGMQPLKGMRFKMANRNYDLCEAEFIKLSEFERQDFDMILRPGCPPIPYEPVVHYNIVCDGTNVSPIFGTRFKKVGQNYDLCLGEFVKLSEEQRREYEIIFHPKAAPIPYFSHEDKAANDLRESIMNFSIDIPGIMHQVTNNIRRNLHHHGRGRPHHERRHHHDRHNGGRHGRHGRKGCGRHARGRGNDDMAGATDDQPSKAGNVLPLGPLRFGSSGPGVRQLQHFLIDQGLMDESAIRYRSGFFAICTQQAISNFQRDHNVKCERNGMYCNITRDALLNWSKVRCHHQQRVASPVQIDDVVPVPSAPSPLSTILTQREEQERKKKEQVEKQERKKKEQEEEQERKKKEQEEEQERKKKEQKEEQERKKKEQKEEQERKKKEQEEEQEQQDKHWEDHYLRVEPPQRYEAELNLLADMGFVDSELLLPLLDRMNGSVEATIAELC